MPRIEAIIFADEVAKFVAENQQEVDFSAERLDGAFLADQQNQSQVDANLDDNRQKTNYSAGPENNKDCR